jgi:streptogramin lyase
VSRPLSALIVCATLCLVWVQAARAAPTAITEFSDGITVNPHRITAGADGNLWFNAYGEGERAIGRITPGGEITEFTEGLEGFPGELVLRPDGDLWFGLSNPPAIGRIAPDGTITRFTTSIRTNTSPHDLALGPEGNLWFASTGGTRPSVGKVAPSGAITQFDLADYPGGIVAGPDGNMWFTYGGDSSSAIGRIVEKGDGGTTITIFHGGMSGEGDPGQIIAGPDGNLWYLDGWTDAIGKATTAGVVTEFADLPGFLQGDMVAGPDGNVWFTLRSGIGRITPDGAVSRFMIPEYGESRSPRNIVVGPEGDLWFTIEADRGSGAIGRITTSGEVTEYLTGINPQAQPNEIVVGPEGNLWFTDQGTPPAIGRIVPGDDSVPPPPAPPADSLPTRGVAGRLQLGHTIRVPAGGRMRLPVRCVGGTHCAGRLTLTAKLRRADGKRVEKVVGSAPFSIRAGEWIDLWVRLSGRGLSLMRAQEGRLVTKVTAFGAPELLAATQRARVMLVAAGGSPASRGSSSR